MTTLTLAREFHPIRLFCGTFKRFAVEIDEAPTLTGKISKAEYAVSALRQDYASMIGLDETLFRKWRRELRLGPRLTRALGIAKSSDKQALEF